MKEKYIHIILLILIFTFPGALITLRAQSPTLDLKIEIKDETYNQKMANAEVVIYKNGAPYKKLTTDDKGRLFVQVPLGVDYKVEFKKNGYVTKHIIIDTKNIPSEDASYGFEYPMEVNLFEDIPEIDFSILQKPVAILKFDNKTGFFEYDKDYTNSILKQLEELKKAYQEKMKALAEQRKKMEAEYNAAINAGNKAFNEKKYAEAKAQFEKALSIKPNEIYPANKIKEIEELLKQMAEKDRQYNDLIQQADQLAQNEKYPEAIQLYKQALAIKPGETYPQNRIKELDELIKNKEKIEKQYNDLIAKADNQFKAQDYENARANYEEASKLKPSEKYPQDRIAEINKILVELSAKEEQYKNAIQKGDDLYKQQKFEEAIKAYQEALTIKPNETYPQNQIQLAQAQLNERKEKQKQYESLIAEADKLFNNKQLIQAKSVYKQALNVLPNEKYPAEQIALIDKTLAETEEINKKYDLAVKEADAAFSSKNYQLAKQKYEEALQLKPNESYPQQQLQKIEQILAEENKRNQEYNQWIAKADEAFGKQSWDEAKKYYEESLKIKDDPYPKNKIQEIENIKKQKLAEEAEKQKIEEQYKKIIAQADMYLGQKSYEAAKAKYNEALGLKPQESYPKEKIEEIDAILAKLAKEQEEILLKAEKEKQQKAEYEALIASGDNKIKSGDYQGAKSDFLKALEIFPNENYPQLRLKYIEEQLAKKAKEDSLAAEAERKKQEYYEALIKKADADFDAGQYDKAKENYVMASMVKPDEEYPKQRLKEIEKILLEKTLAEEKEKQNEQLKQQKEKEYKDWLAKGEKFLGLKDYQEALNAFTKASEIKPEENYPKERIAYINDLLSELNRAKEEQDRINKEYSELISKADMAFNQQKYQEALEMYQQASNLKPQEIYPIEKIKEINKILEELAFKQKQKMEDSLKMAELRRQYDEIIQQADLSFNNQNYDLARKQYLQASSILPNETYPRDRINEIDNILKQHAQKVSDSLELAEKRMRYNEIIRLADISMSQKLYQNALKKYQEALELLPGESYPQKQIDKINLLLSRQNNTNDEDNNAIRVSVTKDKENELDNMFAQMWNARDKSKVEEMEKKIENLYKQYEERAQKANNKIDENYYLIQQMEKSIEERNNRLNQIHQDNFKKMQEFEQYLANLDQRLRQKEEENIQAKYRQQQELEKNFEDFARKKEKEYQHNTGEFYQEIKIYGEKQQLWAQNADQIRLANQERLKDLEQYQQEMIKRGNEKCVEKLQQHQQMIQELDEQHAKLLAASEEKRLQNLENIQQLQQHLEELDRQKRANDIVKWQQTQKKIEEWQATLQQYQQNQETNIERNRRQIRQLEENIAIRASKGDQLHQKNVQNQQLFEQALIRMQQERDEYYSRKQQLAYRDLQDKMKGWETARQERAEMFMYRNVSNLQKYEEMLAKTHENYVNKHNQRREKYYQDIKEIAEQMEKYKAKKDKEYELKLKEIERKTREYEEFQHNLAELSYAKIKNYKMDYYRGEPKPKTSELSGKYPQGVVEEVKPFENGTILRRIVTNGSQVDVYEKIYYKWGGVYYTKNGRHITQAIWDAETLK